MTGIVTLTSKNQLTLPVALVRLLGLVPGTRLWVREDEKKIVLEKMGDFASLQGILANHPLSKKRPTAEIIKLARKRRAARIMSYG